MWRKQTFEWFSPLKGGETSVEDCQFSHCSPTGCKEENVEKVHKIFKRPTNTISEIADRLGLSYGKFKRILRGGLNMRRIFAKFVAWLLTDDDKTFLVAKNMTVVPHPLYSPDLAPCESLFPRTKSQRRECT
jgi:hypothetical protein